MAEASHTTQPPLQTRYDAGIRAWRQFITHQCTLLLLLPLLLLLLLLLLPGFMPRPAMMQAFAPGAGNRASLTSLSGRSLPTLTVSSREWCEQQQRSAAVTLNKYGRTCFVVADHPAQMWY
jgi:hypothetical protein